MIFVGSDSSYLRMRHRKLVLKLTFSYGAFANKNCPIRRKSPNSVENNLIFSPKPSQIPSPKSNFDRTKVSSLPKLYSNLVRAGQESDGKVFIFSLKRPHKPRKTLGEPTFLGEFLFETNSVFMAQLGSAVLLRLLGCIQFTGGPNN